METKNVIIQIGSPLSTLLTVLFVGLRLANIITWSWWWVLAPLWAPIALGLGLILIMYIVIMVIRIVQSIVGR